MRDRADARRKFEIVQGSAAGIEPGKFAELHRGARHDKAAAGVPVSRILAARFYLQIGKTILIFEHSGVLEGEGVAIETKLRRYCPGSDKRESDENAEAAKTRRCEPITRNHIKRARKPLQFCLE